MSAPPGWHQQPEGRERYWNGAAWTDQFRGGEARPPVPQPQPDKRGFYRSWMGYVGSGVLGLLVGIGMGSAGGNPDDAASAAPAITQTTQSTVTATATATAIVTSTPTPEAAAPQPPAATAAPETPEATAAPEVFKMPNLVGENLQLAQDKLQKLGSYVLDQQDAAGLDRVQVLDSNWKVCSQKPAPSKTVSADTIVVLASVKLSEDCP